MYNLTNISGGHGMAGLFISANTYSGGILWNLFIVGIFFVFFFRLKKFAFEDALAVSSLVAFVLSGILLYGNFIGMMLPTVFLILTACSAFYLYLTR